MAKLFGFNGSRWGLLYFPFKGPQMVQRLLSGNSKWVTCLSLSIKFLIDTCPHIKKSQLALIGILACSFCGKFCNGHGSRTPSTSPQETFPPQQTDRLLVLALGSFVTITVAMYRTLPLRAGARVSWRTKKTPCAVGSSQAGVSSWPWRGREVWGRCWGSCLGTACCP